MKTIKNIFVLLLIVSSFSKLQAQNTSNPLRLQINKYGDVFTNIEDGERLRLWGSIGDRTFRIKGSLAGITKDSMMLDNQSIAISDISALRCRKPFRNAIGFGLQGGGAFFGGVIVAVFLQDPTDDFAPLLLIIAIPVAAVYGVGSMIATKKFKFNKSDKWSLKTL